MQRAIQRAVRRDRRPARPARRARAFIAAAAAAALLGSASPAAADDYDPLRAGHPLRIIAYALHPIGVAFDYLLFRPAHWLGHKEPIRTIFGHTGEQHPGYRRDHPHEER
jgi:hypothetical protein